MYEFTDAIELFVGVVNGLSQKQVSLNSSLDEIVLKASGTDLAYVDNRRDANEKFGFDFWYSVKRQFEDARDFIDWMKVQGIDEHILYSKSEHFPDFMFKCKKQQTELACGSLLELKDSKGGSIASFNSTLPTKYKSLDEVDTINGDNLVSRMASIMDGQLATDKNYRTFQRRNFYLIRTHKDAGSSKEQIIETVFKKIPGIDVFTIQHMRNGEHVVLQIKF
jgi:hypothetical protein